MMPQKITDWELTYTDWNSEQQPLREALCALGNGYIVSRGAFEEINAGGSHYPGTYLAGGYNRLETEIAGHVIENESLVNWPNWMFLTFRPEGGDWLNLNAVDLLEFSYRLDVYRGVLERKIRFRDPDDREFSLTSRRIVHMEMPHMAAIEWRLTSHNWSGPIEIRSALDGSVTNQNVDRYRQLNGKHLETVDRGLDGEDITFLKVRTSQSRIEMAQASKVHVFQEGEPVATKRERHLESDRAVQHLFLSCESQKELRIEKIVAIYTSRDFAIAEPSLDACKAVRRNDSFEKLLRSHERKWRHLWSVANINLHDGNSNTQFILRFHIFHLLQTTSTNTVDRDVGVPSRGWHGEAYRGHILWDELFIFPFLTLRIPELTRSLLMYRCRRLPEARYLAKQAGYGGAMFPWQSGSNGREESQDLHLNPRSGRWIPDNSNIQRHVNAAIAYNVWQYYQATRDSEFLAYYGAELLLEIARFWASIVTYNADRDRYEIRGVMGPDEFHTGYPGAEKPGLNNNAYTNVMAAWVLRCAVSVLDFVGKKRRQELMEILEIDDEELLRWDKVSRRMFVPFHDDNIISQFEGYEDLKEFDWEGYREKYGDIHRLDRILEAENDDVNRYKASKQADALMLFYLFSTDALHEIFEHMGYPFDDKLIPDNINYYMQRTAHGSTLSRFVHSWVLARSDSEQAWELFKQALHSDIGDTQGGTTPEGIHLGAMAGTVDFIQRCYMGLEMRDDVLWFNPLLPRQLSDIELQFRYRGHWLWLRLTKEKLVISCERGCPHPVKLGFGDRVCELAQGETQEFCLQ